MARQLDARIRNALVAQNRWKEFCARRTALNQQVFSGAITPEQRDQTIRDEYAFAFEALKTPLPAKAETRGADQPPADDTSEPAASPARSSNDAREILRWVYEHLGDTEAQLAKPKPPSPGALAHLLELRASPDLKRDFYNTVYPKLLPSRSELNRAERMNDDGRTTLELIGRVAEACRRAAVSSAGAKDAGGKS